MFWIGNSKLNLPIFVPADSLLGSGTDDEEEDESRAANNASSPAHAPHPALHSELSLNGDAKPHDDSEDQVSCQQRITKSCT